MRISVLLLAALLAVPAFAASSEVTIPIGGFLDLPNDLTYRTEMTVTNHRNVLQYVTISMIKDGHVLPYHTFALNPHETKFLEKPFPTGGGFQSSIGAIRVAAQQTASDPDDPAVPDTAGQIEAKAFIIAERGRFKASSRQELEGIPSADYTAKQAVFLGVRHDDPTYTNVGIVNLHPTEYVTFFVEFQYLAPVAVNVAPLSLSQVRIPGRGNAGRWVKVYPEWSLSDALPAHTTPWVAYASTVDGYTGDAFSGIRVPPESHFGQ